MESPSLGKRAESAAAGAGVGAESVSASTGSNPPLRGVARSNTQAAKSVNIACRFYLSPGGCKRGQECNYIHADPNQVEKSGSERSASTLPASKGEGQDGGPSVLPSNSERPCKWMLAGYCRRGNSCWFSHNLDLANARQTTSDQVAKEQADSSSSKLRDSAVPHEPTTPSGGLQGSSGEVNTADKPEGKKEEQEDEEEDECSICTEPFHGSFGLMPNCSHVFCLSCLQKWRKNEDHDTNRKSCPVCRTVSNFILPSNRQYKDPTEKAGALAKYLSVMAAVPCRNFERSKDSDRLYCSFGDDCFYLHRTSDGKPYKFGVGAAEMRKAGNRRRFRSGTNITRVTTDFFDVYHSDDNYDELYRDGYDGYGYDFDDDDERTLDRAFDAFNFGVYDFDLDGEEEEEFAGFAEQFL